MICARGRELLATAERKLNEISSPNQSVISVPCDVSSEEEVAGLVDRAISELGSIEILVSNAGVYGPMGPFESVDFKDWIRSIEINLYGSVLPCRALVPHLKRLGQGKIICLSGGGATSPVPFISSYAASKAASVRFMETIAGELKPFKIDVNGLAPGPLNTRLLEEVLASGPEKVGDEFYTKAVKQKNTGGVSLKLGAELCVFLASGESDGITGKLISANWDPWKRLSEYKAELDSSDIYCLRRIVPRDRGLDWSK